MAKQKHYPGQDQVSAGNEDAYATAVALVKAVGRNEAVAYVAKAKASCLPASAKNTASRMFWTTVAQMLVAHGQGELTLVGAGALVSRGDPRVPRETPKPQSWMSTKKQKELLASQRRSKTTSAPKPTVPKYLATTPHAKALKMTPAQKKAKIDYASSRGRAPAAPGDRLWYFEWQKGSDGRWAGYNSVKAPNAKEAVKRGNRISKGLKVDTSTLREVTQAEMSRL